MAITTSMAIAMKIMSTKPHHQLITTPTKYITNNKFKGNDERLVKMIRKIAKDVMMITVMIAMIIYYEVQNPSFQSIRVRIIN